MKKIIFKSVFRFTFNDNHYEMFKTNDEKIAFLKLNGDDYEYPSMEEFVKLTNFFAINTRILSNKTSFIPSVKVKIKGGIKLVALTSMLLMNVLFNPEVVNALDDSYIIINDPSQYNIESEYLVSEEDAKYLEEYYRSGYKSNLTTPQVINSILSNPGIVNDPNARIAECDDLRDTLDIDLTKIDIIYDKYYNRLRLLNSKYFDVLFSKENYSINEINSIIDSNPGIPSEYKSFVKDFYKTMSSYYQGIDNRVFVENLKTLVITLNDTSYFEDDMVACYDIDNNTIHLNKTFNISKTQSKLDLRHELGHLFNNIMIYKNGYYIQYDYSYNAHGLFFKETMNVLFTTKPFANEYENQKLNKGYEVLTGMTEIFNEAVNFDYRDYVTSNIYMYEKEMNETSGINIDFNHIEDIYEFVWDDYVTVPYLNKKNQLEDKFSIDPEYKNEFFYYLSRLYINKFIDPDISYEEVDNKISDFYALLCKDVTDTSVFDFDTLDKEFDDYRITHIITSHTSRGR